MSFGIQIFNQNGTLSFDSTLATGGVCLGFFTVPAGGTVYNFTDYIGAVGIALNSGQGRQALVYTTDSAPGYLRFLFPAAAAGSVVVLFAK